PHSESNDTPPPLPPKSDFVLSEQQALAKHQNDLHKFADMGEEVPPRVPMDRENKSSEGDVKDLKDLLDRSVFNIQDLNLSQSNDLLNAIAKNPIFTNNQENEHRNSNGSLKNYMNELLSEVGENFPHKPEAEDYEELRQNIYTNLEEKMMNNPKIEDYIKNFNPSNQEHYERLAKELITHYSDALKDAKLNTTDTNVHFSGDIKNGFYSPNDGDIHMPTPKNYLKNYFKNQNPTPEEVGLHVLNEVVREMTHKQQDLLVKNMDNPDISQNIKDYASLIDLNFKFSPNANKDAHHLDPNNILNKEASDHGNTTMRKYGDFIRGNSSSDNPGDLAQTKNTKQKKPFLERLRNVFAKKNPQFEHLVQNPEPSLEQGVQGTDANSTGTSENVDPLYEVIPEPGHPVLGTSNNPEPSLLQGAQGVSTNPTGTNENFDPSALYAKVSKPKKPTDANHSEYSLLQAPQENPASNHSEYSLLGAPQENPASNNPDPSALYAKVSKPKKPTDANHSEYSLVGAPQGSDANPTGTNHPEPSFLQGAQGVSTNPSSSNQEAQNTSTNPSSEAHQEQPVSDPSALYAKVSKPKKPTDANHSEYSLVGAPQGSDANPTGTNHPEPSFLQGAQGVSTNPTEP
ncbi:hypothetical protein, partial [Helicobacter sp. 13S00482-2]